MPLSANNIGHPDITSVKVQGYASVFVCYLDDRDEHADPHHQHYLPDTRHDRPGQTDLPAEMVELWPCSVA